MNLLQKIKNDKILNMINSITDNEIYLVGGAVRDFVMGKDTFDRDLIICDEGAKEFSQKLADKLNAVFVPLDEVNKIYRLVLEDKQNYIDITNPIENSLIKDLERRDLSINAVAVNLKTQEIVDPYNGLSDIKNKQINAIKEVNFTDDPLRLLRIFRFKSTLGFEVSTELKNIVKKYSDLISKPAIERVIYELVKLFGGKNAHEALLLMDECGLLDKIFPFVSELKQVPPNSHHHLDLFHHSVETVKQIQILYDNSSDEIKGHLDSVDFGGFSRLAHLKLAGFMHDIGKFSTWAIIEGRHRFIKHDDVGAKIAEKFLKDMHFSNKQILYLKDMIKYHIYPSSVMASSEITDKIMMRFVRKMTDNSIDVIILAMADRLSAQGPEITADIIKKNINSLQRLMNFYLDNVDTLKPLPVLLDGNEIMQILKIKPSQELGQIITKLHEAQLDGVVTTHAQAVDFVKNIF